MRRLARDGSSTSRLTGDGGGEARVDGRIRADCAARQRACGVHRHPASCRPRRARCGSRCCRPATPAAPTGRRFRQAASRPKGSKARRPDSTCLRRAQRRSMCETPGSAASVPGQSGTGAFMKLSAPSGTRLVGASTPAAGVAEVHEMKMEGDTMRMRAAGTLDLPARQTVELKPGGYHLMLHGPEEGAHQGQPPCRSRCISRTPTAWKSSKELDVPVLAGAAAPAGSEHKH